jgi:preprotein translocase subunit SecD|tara:strand:+ start:13664 stop:15214 length:1551 start_codon:yes stop_codon:yes gene_type:complete
VLNFTKIRVFLIYSILLIAIFFSSLNFESNNIIDKKVNLGLDLQGGSYILLEIDTSPLVNQKLQSKVIPIKKFLNKNKIIFKDFLISKKNITFSVDKVHHKKLENIFFLRTKENVVNNFITNYNTFELDLNIEQDLVTVNFSNYGLVSLNNAALKQSIEIIRRRIDDVGTKEPSILQRGDKRILVELPGIDNPERVKELLGKTAQLTFRLVSNDKEFGSEKLILSDTNEELIVNKRVVVSGDNLIDAQPQFDSQSNQPIVTFTLDRLGSQKFGKTTTENVGKRLAIILDNAVISAPQIREAITAGTGTISGGFSFQEATDLALLLRSGALPTPINIVEERTVGPDLGKDSIDAGIFSLMIGFALVILFMFYKYKIFGLISNISLISNLILLIGILTLMEATLTLPGIAGIILTVGMAVDSNVLIYERIKEELKTEKSIIHAFDVGYNKAKITVIDANVTTLIAAVILFIFGSGPVKGFAVTLGVGIVTTLFSAYFIARHLTSVVVLKDRDGKFFNL